MPDVQIPAAIQKQIDAENARIEKRDEALNSFHPGIPAPAQAEPAVTVAQPLTVAEPAAAPVVTATKETMSTSTVIAPKESFIQKVEADAKKAWTVIEKIGEDADKGLTIANSYMPSAEAIAAIFFPPAVSVLKTVQGAMSLALNTIAEIKQKSALIPAGLSGEAMTAQEIALAGPSVLALLQAEGLPQADAAYVQNLLNTLVGILQVTVVPTSTVATAA